MGPIIFDIILTLMCTIFWYWFIRYERKEEYPDEALLFMFCIVTLLDILLNFALITN